MDGYMFEGGCQAYGGLPDILNSHVPPPPYTTLPGRGHGAISPPSRHNSRAGGGGTWDLFLLNLGKADLQVPPPPALEL